ncbi:MAG: hypothetical protein HC923_06940 [Myxococcales bacterium]|nr:hypothetical protein [Myxococcales bacterium]
MDQNTAIFEDRRKLTTWLSGANHSAADDLRYDEKMVAAYLEPHCWLAPALERISRLQSDHHPGIETVARREASTLLDTIYYRTSLRPTRISSSAEGGIAVVFEVPGRYADVECLNDGSVVAGLTDFEGHQEVHELYLDNRTQVVRVLREIQRFIERP